MPDCVSPLLDFHCRLTQDHRPNKGPIILHCRYTYMACTYVYMHISSCSTCTYMYMYTCTFRTRICTCTCHKMSFLKHYYTMYIIMLIYLDEYAHVLSSHTNSLMSMTLTQYITVLVRHSPIPAVLVWDAQARSLCWIQPWDRLEGSVEWTYHTSSNDYAARG